MTEDRTKINSVVILAPVVFLVVSVAVALFLCRNGSYPDGAETMYHLHRGQLVYRSAADGDLWPSYDPSYYNGTEPLRYDAPLSAWVLALCMAFAGGDSLNGYLVFVGLVCFFGAMAWLFVGTGIGRPAFGALIGILWFFVPNNLFALLREGTLGYSLGMVLLPLLLFAVDRYLREPKWTILPYTAVLFGLICLCDFNLGGLLALGMAVYFLFTALLTHQARRSGELALAIAAGILLTGFWFWGAAHDGNPQALNTELLEQYFQSLFVSADPTERLDTDGSQPYFGVAMLILALLGGVCGSRRSMPGFWTAVVLFLCTSSALYGIARLLPAGGHLQMLRLFSAACGMILFSFLIWGSLRRTMALLMIVLLCLDTVPSLSMLYGSGNGEAAEARMKELQEGMLVGKAKEITEQRMAFLDGGRLDSLGAWLVSDLNGPTDGTFGAGWKAAHTYNNVTQLNRALSSGNYLYLFDRCKFLGNDTVLVDISPLGQYYDETVDRTDGTNQAAAKGLDAAAERNGYDRVAFNDRYHLYHLSEEGNWGTTSTYRAIAIGSGTSDVARSFPAFREADSHVLDAYTFEELSAYDLIYLDGFTYDDREAAEELVLRLSEAGVRVIIAADGIPQDRDHSCRFLDVTCNEIQFTNGYPELDTIDGILNTDLFPQGYTEWNTVYLEGLDDCWGTVLEDQDGVTLDFYGTVKNDNIIMIGLNLTYFYGLTKDISVGVLLNHAMDLSPNELPKRSIVPLDIDFDGETITIDSPEDNVNTGLACLDSFDCSRETGTESGLLLVQEGKTTLICRNPYLAEGAAVSACGLLGLVLLCCRVRRKRIMPNKNS